MQREKQPIALKTPGSLEPVAEPDRRVPLGVQEDHGVGGGRDAAAASCRAAAAPAWPSRGAGAGGRKPPWHPEKAARGGLGPEPGLASA